MFTKNSKLLTYLMLTYVGFLWQEQFDFEAILKPFLCKTSKRAISVLAIH